MAIFNFIAGVLVVAKISKLVGKVVFSRQPLDMK